MDEKTQLTIPSFFEAINYLFKFYITFNLPYPIECDNICFFYQRKVLDITRESGEKDLNAVEAIIKKLEVYEKKL